MKYLTKSAFPDKEKWHFSGKILWRLVTVSGKRCQKFKKHYVVLKSALPVSSPQSIFGLSLKIGSKLTYLIFHNHLLGTGSSVGH